MSDYENDNWSDDIFDQSVDMTEVDAESVRGSGGTISKPGLYHMIIKSVELDRGVKPEDATSGKPPRMVIVMEAVAGTEKSELDKKLYHTIYFGSWLDRSNHMLGLSPISDLQVEQRNTLLWAAGIFFQGQSRKVDYVSELEGCQLVAKIEKRDYKDRTYHQVSGFGKDLWPVNHADVASCPKNQELINLESHVANNDDISGL